MQHYWTSDRDELSLTGLSSELFTLHPYVLLHAHPLLGSVLVNKFPRRPILGKQSVARLLNNSRGCVLYVVRSKQQQEQGCL
jgi:hypothetical protein